MFNWVMFVVVKLPPLRRWIRRRRVKSLRIEAAKLGREIHEWLEREAELCRPEESAAPIENDVPSNRDDLIRKFSDLEYSALDVVRRIYSVHDLRPRLENDNRGAAQPHLDTEVQAAFQTFEKAYTALNTEIRQAGERFQHLYVDAFRCIEAVEGVRFPQEGRNWEGDADSAHTAIKVAVRRGSFAVESGVPASGP